ncbi:MAG: 3-dehydroquinate synthase [Myxococcales bacterium 68-20]|nr:3-dehydroquinate synthase [Myxococcales bacterium]OJY18373.1 MAG: 3-dehydroquinate synthase [Myxococcales bacterium 68-20]
MRTVVLSGFMATGKSTIGRLVAEKLGLPFLDTDAILAEEVGRPVGEIFAAEGEARFRDHEARIIQPLLADGVPRVLSFGGGSMTIPRVRHAALEAATVVTLTATPETIAARVPSPTDRPNLGAASVLDRARDLIALRREVYGECHASIATDGRAPEEIAACIVELARRDTVAIPLGVRSYVVELTHGRPDVLGAALKELAPSSIVTVTDENLVTMRGAWLDAALASLGLRETRIVLSPGEANKTLASISRIWDAALSEGVDRQAVVVAFGGGVAGDLAGFAASTLLRGVRCVQVPTSLLSMVDSSVGGKTGFDHAAGKNLLGAFFQPSRVVIDLEHLKTLPPRERRAGLAEVVKIALVREPPLLELLESRAEAIARGDRDVLRDVVRASVIAKMRVVREDEHETGARALLNLGHTLGHALESHGGYARWLHGEAVAIGTVLEIAAAERLGLTPAGTSERAASLFERFGLPTTVDLATVDAAWPYVMSDKKRTLSAVKLPVVTGPGEGRVERVELDALRAAVTGAE